MPQFLPLPTSINVGDPTLRGFTQAHLVSPHTSAIFTPFFSSPSFNHVLLVFVFQLGRFGRAKRWAILSHTILVFHYPVANLFLHFTHPVEQDSKGTYTLLRSHNPSFQLQGISLPRVVLLINPTRLS